jgi:archaeal type IV pilus assembly protein PilA
MTRMNNHAVSPVVGVMLMLVVTIIIAAIVSAFAGGLSESNDKAPNVQIIGHYSQAQGMWFENEGPEDVSTATTTVLVRLSDSFGNAEHMVWTVNKTSVTNTSAIPTSETNADKLRWLKAGGLSGVKAFKVGDRAYIVPPYHNSTFLQPDASSTYSISNPDNLGGSFYIELIDKSGKTFAKTKVKIEA